MIREPFEFRAWDALQDPDVRQSFNHFLISHGYTVSR